MKRILIKTFTLAQKTNFHLHQYLLANPESPTVAVAMACLSVIHKTISKKKSIPDHIDKNIYVGSNHGQHR